MIGLKISRRFFIQSEVNPKPKPITTHLNMPSCALRQPHLITLSLDWFTVLSVPFEIG